MRLGFGNGLLDMTHIKPTSNQNKQTNKQKHKLDFIKVKNFFASKIIIKKLKRQPCYWEKNIYK